jgi:hypothetical protein
MRDSGRGQGIGRGGQRQGMRGAGGTSVCRCPKCGHSEPHVRGTPCTKKKCPKCGVALRGDRCS